MSGLDRAGSLPRRAYLGMELGRRRGVLHVTDLDADSPAARAGIALGDQLLRVAGQPALPA